MDFLRHPVFKFPLFLIFAIIFFGCDSSVNADDKFIRTSSPYENYEIFEISANVHFYGDNSYAIYTNRYKIFSEDSSFTAIYAFPKIKYLADSIMEVKINKLLEMQFLADMVDPVAFQEYSKAKKGEKSASYWETIEVNYTIGLTTKNFMTIAYEYIQEHKDMKSSKFENKYFNINLEKGELVDSLDYFFNDGYKPALEKQLNNATENYTTDAGYYFKIDPDIDYQFGFFEDEFGINLKIYVQPDSAKIADQTQMTKMSDFLPKLFYAPLDSIAELIDTSCVLKSLLESKTHELQ